MPRAPEPSSRQVNFRLPTTVWARLTAAAAVLGQTQSQIVTDALTFYFDHLPPATRRLIAEAMSLREKL